MALTYAAALERLGRKTSLQVDKKRGTEIVRKDADIVIRHHGDAVVTIHPDDTYTLRTGIMATATKRRRIAEYSPVSIVVKNGGVWAVRSNGEMMPFLEGMRVDLLGRPLDEASIRAGYGARGGATGKAGEAGEVPESDVLRLRKFIRRELMSYLHELGITDLIQRGTLAPQPQLGPPRDGQPVRAAKSIRAVVQRMAGGPERNITGPQAEVLPGLIPLMQGFAVAAGATPEGAERQAKTLYDSIYQGRVPGTGRGDKGTEGQGDTGTTEPEVPPAPPAVHVVDEETIRKASLCPKCHTPIIAHFDKASHRRGCDYAREHPTDLGTI